LLVRGGLTFEIKKVRKNKQQRYEKSSQRRIKKREYYKNSIRKGQKKTLRVGRDGKKV